jgi:hypothetical protein
MKVEVRVDPNPQIMNVFEPPLDRPLPKSLFACLNRF